MSQAFAVWLTGLPASGKSSIARELKAGLAAAGFEADVLESDAVRNVITPVPSYFREERDLFYRALAFCGSRLVAHGVPVIFDATANRREYRDLARTLIPHFVEVAVVCPLKICQQKDRKGTYRKALDGTSSTVPGLQETYDPPLRPDLAVDTTRLSPQAAAAKILEVLHARRYLADARDIPCEFPLIAGRGDRRVVLDTYEQQVLTQFLQLLQEERFDPEPKAELGRIMRGAEGQVIVPVMLNAEAPSLSFALLMGQKAEHLYKLTNCRFVLAQRPVKDPHGKAYVWDGKDWRSLS